MNPFKRDSSSGVVFRDLIFNALLGAFALLIIVIFHVNPEGTDEDAEFRLPGDMVVEIEWDGDNNLDVDLIIRDPYDYVMFFREPSTPFFDLLRDDRGSLDDDGPYNYEHAFARGVPDGQYVVNLYVYSMNDGRLPVDVDVRIWIRDSNRRPQQVFEETLTLYELRTELTAVSFYTINGQIVENSIDKYTQIEVIPPIEFTHEQE